MPRCLRRGALDRHRAAYGVRDAGELSPTARRPWSLTMRPLSQAMVEVDALAPMLLQRGQSGDTTSSVPMSQL